MIYRHSRTGYASFTNASVRKPTTAASIHNPTLAISMYLVLAAV
jgi:hypothetical protein